MNETNPEEGLLLIKSSLSIFGEPIIITPKEDQISKYPLELNTNLFYMSSRDNMHNGNLGIYFSGHLRLLRINRINDSCYNDLARLVQDIMDSQNNGFDLVRLIGAYPLVIFPILTDFSIDYSDPNLMFIGRLFKEKPDESVKICHYGYGGINSIMDYHDALKHHKVDKKQLEEMFVHLIGKLRNKADKEYKRKRSK